VVGAFTFTIPTSKITHDSAFTGLGMAGLLAFVLGPLYWIAVTAFKSETQVVTRTHDLWPTPWTLEQFGALFTNQPFGR
jgi:multiple sugar transport system permease protein